MTSEEYWKEIESIAREVTREAREYGREVYEVLHEILNDGHSWVIWDKYFPYVLAHSDNSSYGLNEGLIVKVDHHDQYMKVAATWAIYADVIEHESFDADPEDDDDTA